MVPWLVLITPSGVVYWNASRDITLVFCLGGSVGEVFSSLVRPIGQIGFWGLLTILHQWLVICRFSWGWSTLASEKSALWKKKGETITNQSKKSCRLNVLHWVNVIHEVKVKIHGANVLHKVNVIHEVNAIHGSNVIHMP